MSSVDIKDYDEKWIHLGHLLRRSGIFKACYTKVIPSGLFRAYPQMEVLLQLAIDYYDTYGDLIPEAVIDLELEGALAERDLSLGQGTVDKIRYWYALPDNSDKWIDTFTKAELVEHFRTHTRDVLTYQLGQAVDTDEAEELIADARRDLGTNPFLAPKPKSPFEDIEGNLEMAELRPWGVNYMDNILGGGSAIGESIGVLLPSGGGKTTMALQILAAHVMRGEHCVYMSSEQDLGGDMSVRMAALSIGVGRSEFKQGFKGLSKEHRDMLNAVKPEWNKYCHFCEWAHKSIDNLDSMFEVVRDLNAQGIYPKTIIWDWWGRIRTALIMSLKSKNADPTTLRLHSQNWLHQLRTKGGELGMKSIVFHQLAGSEAKKSAKNKPSSHSAQEDTNFNNMFDYCFTGSGKDEDGVITFIADKARTAANTDIRLYLNGEMCRFEYAEFGDTGEGMLDDDDDEEDFSARDAGLTFGED